MKVSFALALTVLVASSAAFAGKEPVVVTKTRVTGEIPIAGTISTCQGNGMQGMITEDQFVVIKSEFHYSACVEIETYDVEESGSFFRKKRRELPGTASKKYQMRPLTAGDSQFISKNPNDPTGSILNAGLVASSVTSACNAKRESKTVLARPISETGCSGN